METDQKCQGPEGVAGFQRGPEVGGLADKKMTDTKIGYSCIFLSVIFLSIIFLSDALGSSHWLLPPHLPQIDKCTE
jgi:hypothetical protein